MLGATSPTSLFNTHYNDLGPPERAKQRTVKVFLSYSHRDHDVAHKICQSLVAEGLSVVMDSGALAPGRSIQEFIEQGVGMTDATVSLVSKYSLVSAWVALESEEALSRQRKSFFACYVDEEFLRRGFVDEALEHVDVQIAEIGVNIKTRIDRRRRFQDLYADLQRYETLRESIDKIVARLRETACLDLRANVFDQNLKKLAQTLRDL